MKRQNEGTTTLDSAGNGSTRGREPRPMGLGRAPRADDPKAGARTKNRSIPTTGSQTSMDPRHGSQRSDRSGYRQSASHRTDLRAGIRCPKLSNKISLLRLADSATVFPRPCVVFCPLIFVISSLQEKLSGRKCWAE